MFRFLQKTFTFKNILPAIIGVFGLLIVFGSIGLTGSSIVANAVDVSGCLTTTNAEIDGLKAENSTLESDLKGGKVVCRSSTANGDAFFLCPSIDRTLRCVNGTLLTSTKVGIQNPNTNGGVQISGCSTPSEANLAGKTIASGKFGCMANGKIYECGTAKGGDCVSIGDAAVDKGGDPAGGLIGFVLGFVEAIVLVLMYIVNWVLSFVLWIMGLVVVNLVVINPVSGTFISVAENPWKTLVSLGNLLTLTTFVFVGLGGYVLNIQSLKTDIKTFLLNIAVFTLLMNFTLFGLSSAINVTQGLGDSMIAAFTGKAPSQDIFNGGQNDLIDGVLQGIKNISVVRCGNFGGNGIDEMKCPQNTNTDTANQGNVADKALKTVANAANVPYIITFGGILSGKVDNTLLRSMMLEVVYCWVLVLSIFAFWRLGKLAIFRLIGLWFLVVASPLALAAYFSPIQSIKKYANDWAEKTWQLALFYPVLILSLILTSQVTLEFSRAINCQFAEDKTSCTTNVLAYNQTIQSYAEGTEGLAGVFKILVGTILVGVFAAGVLMVMTEFVDKLIGPFAKAVGGALKKAWEGAKTGSQVLGGGARFLNKAMGNQLGNQMNRFANTTFGKKFGLDKMADLTRREEKTKDRIAKMQAAVAQRKLLADADPTAQNKKILAASRKKLTDYQDKLQTYRAAKAAAGSPTSVAGLFRGASNVGSWYNKFSDKALEKVQYGLIDIEGIGDKYNALKDSFGNMSKRGQAIRKQQNLGDLALFLAQWQGKGDGPLSNFAAQALYYSKDLNHFGNEITPGVPIKFDDNQLKDRVYRSARDAGNKAAGIDRKPDLTTIKNLFESIADKTWSQLTDAQQDIVEDAMRQVSDDPQLASSVVNSPNMRRVASKFLYDSTNYTTRRELVKKAAALFENPDGTFIESEKAKVEGIPDAIAARARLVAEANKESDLIRNITSAQVGSKTFQSALATINPNRAAELRDRMDLNTAFAPFTAANNINSAINDLNFGNDESKKSYARQLLSDASENRTQVLKGFTNEANMFDYLTKAREGLYVDPETGTETRMNTTEAIQKLYDKFTQQEIGATTREGVENLSLDQLKRTNLGRDLVLRAGDGFTRLSAGEQLEVLKKNAIIAIEDHTPVRESYIQQVKTVANRLSDALPGAKPIFTQQSNLADTTYEIYQHMSESNAASVKMLEFVSKASDNFRSGVNPEIEIGGRRYTQNELATQLGTDTVLGSISEQQLSSGSVVMNKNVDGTKKVYTVKGVPQVTLQRFTGDMYELAVENEAIIRGGGTGINIRDSKYQAIADRYEGTDLKNIILESFSPGSGDLAQPNVVRTGIVNLNELAEEANSKSTDIARRTALRNQLLDRSKEAENKKQRLAENVAKRAGDKDKLTDTAYGALSATS